MAAEIEIRAPEDQTEGTRSHVLQWLKAVGDPVAENEPLLEIETDKVTVEVAAPGAGVLQQILKTEQEEIAPGELLGRIAIEADTSLNAAASNPVTSNPAAPAAQALSSAAEVDARSGADSQAQAASARPDVGRSHAQLSPAVVRLLREYGLRSDEVRASGRDGRITVKDVLAHGAASNPTANPTAAQRSAPTPRPDDAPPAVTDTDSSAPSRWLPHTLVRKRIAEHMVRSLLQTAPHVTTVFDVDMTNTLAHRNQCKDDFARRGVALTLTAYFVQAAVAGLREVPEANSRWTDTALQLFDAMDIGIATAADSGLVVPVLHEAQSLDLFGIAAGLQELVSRARSGSLAPADVRGGTFTISNHGVSGSLLAAPIVINQPQSAILGVGKLEKRAVVINDGTGDEVRIQPRCYVTLTIDHRVMDGHQANRFLQTFVQQMQAPSG
ncbi:MAG: 2-oxo acid dehydrogenase subunit E2 [Sinobacteraceae bacterium]|nr:2-oxo acid dehydrogenase subunit E2 [Nevskiaceae bacterium]